MIATVIASLNISYESLKDQIQRIQNEMESLGKDFLIIISVMENELSDLIKLEEDFSFVTLNSVSTDYSFAMAYIDGLATAVEMGADVIIEMDSGGGHLPEDISMFADPDPVVFSSRFIRGSVNKYPLQRQLVSRLTSFLTFLVNGVWVSDMASGFESFEAEVLKAVFEKWPEETWVSAQKENPFHLYQTEMRLKILAHLGYKPEIVPIKYGVEKSGSSLSPTYLLKAFLCYPKIVRQLKRK